MAVTPAPPVDLSRLNGASIAGFVAALDGIYEHSPWIAERAAAARPFATLAQLRQALVQAVRDAGAPARLALIRAHPELAGKAMVAGDLTAASTDEQSRAGLTHCSAQEYARLQQLNAAYLQRHGFPFILAVRGPRGRGLGRSAIIADFERRLEEPTDVEQAECLRQIHRIAEVRLAERLGEPPVLGRRVWDWAEALAAHSELPWAERGELTVTYLSPAHQACAAQLARWMREECGFDEVSTDAVGNVVGVYHGATPGAPRLLTGSHYDTVRNAGRYDGRLGVLVPMAAVQALHARGRRLPYGIEVVAFGEEEGQRYPTGFLGSSVLAGAFDPAWLELRDAQGTALREAMRDAGLQPRDIPALARDPARYLGYVEVHIEQGPVLTELDLPLGVVTAINGAVRLVCEVRGRASHAGTTPMGQRRDAAAAVAELVLHLEQRAARHPEVVGTVGMLEVPGGSINVVPGRCTFSLDIRATTDAQRDACLADTLAELERVCARRGVRHHVRETMRVAAAPCAPLWCERWARAVQRLGLPVHRLPSGAGHDAMQLHACMPQAMLFVRGQNGGISHNPLEEVTDEDAELAVRAFQALLDDLADPAAPGWPAT